MNNRKAFTIVELLTSVTIIALLLGILLPSIHMVRTKAKETAQKAQFATMDMALEAFKQDYGDYPPSNLNQPPTPPDYCGAQELTEALVGWDLMGFHPKSAWRANGMNSAGTAAVYKSTIANLQERRGPYLELATANAFRIGKLFNTTAPLAADTNVLCDIFKVRKTNDTDSTGKLITAGAPILYYKANTSRKTIDPNFEPNPSNRIYDYSHNRPLIELGKLTVNGNSGLAHPLGYMAPDFQVFYDYKSSYNPATAPGYGGSGIGYGIRDPKIPNPVRPYRPDSYILISAGPDGYYGTADDIHNY